jgi:hypothetical protein
MKTRFLKVLTMKKFFGLIKFSAVVEVTEEYVASLQNVACSLDFEDELSVTGTDSNGELVTVRRVYE